MIPNMMATSNTEFHPKLLAREPNMSQETVVLAYPNMPAMPFAEAATLFVA